VSREAKAAYFDRIATQWDGWHDADAVGATLAAGLAELGVGADETVLDVGCGTGNLTRALLRALSPAGRVEAVDLSPGMIAEARRKIGDPRVAWHVADVASLPIPDASCDRAICLCLWPHVERRETAALELRRVLKPGGALHIWHTLPRCRVNEIHAAAGESVCDDVLPPAGETAEVLSRCGLQVTEAIDDGERYLVSAVREGARHR
jgi:ubiquinone/menaquinone biosynthesis C-methylase UbiE